jgi:hypothetical protein
MISKLRSMKTVHTFVIVLSFGLLPGLAFAAEVLVAPPLYDLELQPRDVVTKDITIRNETDHKIYVYATVNEIAVDDSGDIREFISPVMDTRETAITSWIEITRGRIELEVGEEKTVPLTIRVHPYAPTGEYHAFVGMVSESNRPLADAKTLRGDSDGVIVKVNLEDKASGVLRMTSFLVDRFIVRNENRTISLALKNEGTRSSTPTGEIIFYNSRGEEVSSLPINSEGVSIEPGVEKQFQLTIPFADKLGRFKANATVRYGTEGESTIFDMAQFYMIPYRFLIICIAAIILFSLFVTYLLRRVFYDELHSEEEGGELPLYVRNDRVHAEHDHDIHISKK